MWYWMSSREASSGRLSRMCSTSSLAAFIDGSLAQAGAEAVGDPLLDEGERADRFLLKRRYTRSHGLSGQRAGRSFGSESAGTYTGTYTGPGSEWRTRPPRSRTQPLS